MTSYTITVAPSDGTGNTTTITVDTSNGDALITDVHLHAAEGLTVSRLPAIDVGLLMQAVTAAPAPIQASPVASPALTDKPTQPAPAATPAAAADDTAPATPDAEASVTEPVADVPAPAQPADTATRPPARARRPRPAKEPAAPKPAAKPRARRSAGSAEPEAPAAAPKRRKRAARDETPDAGKERVYRRMPDDFSAVATRLNNASAIAEHYQVPRHTAQGWLRRLRTTATS